MPMPPGRRHRRPDSLPDVALEEIPDDAAVQHEGEQHSGGIAGRLNWLRAGVLGANDGIVSTSGLVIGVAAAGASPAAIATAGFAGLGAGALSMAAGEYVSVSTQRDTETALLAKERRELREQPEEELDELTAIYAGKGLNPELAREVALALTDHDALTAHAEAELGIDTVDLANPWRAAWASMLAFTVGSALPLLTILLLPEGLRVWGTVLAAAGTLALTGLVSARLGGARPAVPIGRNVLGGLAAMAVTYAIGAIVGSQVG
jgi:VIT1/CCC1 family predicted Fe2+/Mn2+ transporter